jgi:hypothetical protein
MYQRVLLGWLIMQAQTIELLSGKGTFSTEQALILAEAIDQVVDKAQFVTVPMLDTRIATVTARIDALDAKLCARIESGEARLEARISSVETRLSERSSSLETKLNARIDSLEVKMDAKFERWVVRIIIVMVLSQTALGPVGMRAFDSLRQIMAPLGH